MQASKLLNSHQVVYCATLYLKRLCLACQVLWDVETGNAICGTPTCTDFTVAIKFLNNDGAKLVTCGNYNLNVWQYDHLTNKLVPSDVQLGQLRRCFTCLAVDAADQYMYCGTATGDVLQVSTPLPLSLLPCFDFACKGGILHTGISGTNSSLISSSSSCWILGQDKFDVRALLHALF